jgi:uncharacterized membrane protein YcaP (DUF421 family)
MEIIHQIFGQGKDLSIAQMCVRAAIMFIVAYLLIRISGRRSFGLHSPLDNIIVILLGGILSRGVVGASPMVAVICASITIVMLHRIGGWLLSIKTSLSKSIDGSKILLFENGKFIASNMRKAMLCKEDVLGAIRGQLHSEDLTAVDRIYMERNGTLSIIQK